MLLDCMIIKHPEPLRGFNYVGLNYYAITWCCQKRKSFSTKADCVDLVRAQLLRAASETEVALVVACFMPDHVHQLVKGCSPAADGRRYMKLAKQYSGYYFKQAYKEKLWQRYGHDRFLRKDQEPRAIIGYILENPVRATTKELIEWAFTY